nr:MAG TPA: hypothetical protein [Caudoviricetes sp.]
MNKFENRICFLLPKHRRLECTLAIPVSVSTA